jgi:hypothetical protein
VISRAVIAEVGIRSTIQKYSKLKNMQVILAQII